MQQAYLKASNTGSDDMFGYASALSGNTLVVGAPGEDSSANTVNPGATKEAANDALGAGAAYVYVRRLGVWQQEAYLKSPTHSLNDAFGSAVAISGDTIAIGATGEAGKAGTVYIFTRGVANWALQATLRPSNPDLLDEFGASLSLQGDTLAIGAPGESSTATGVNGNGANNGAVNSGAVYIFTRSGSQWTQQAYLKASNTGAGDRFGHSISLDANTLVASAYLEDSASTGINGPAANNDAADAGAAYVFERSGNLWSQKAYLKASNTGMLDQFGHSVSISGDTIAVGARCEASDAAGVNGNQASNAIFGAGAVYIYVRANGQWTQQAYLKQSNPGAGDEFGYSVSLSANLLAVGAPHEASKAKGVGGDEADNSAVRAGAVYVFGRSGNLWAQAAYVKASNTDPKDEFGHEVAVSIDTVLTSAPYESSSAKGVNQDGSDNKAFESGAAYVFTIPQDPPTVSAAYSPREVLAGTPSTLTITLENGNPGPMTPVTFTHTLPENTGIAQPNGLVNPCNLPVLAQPGTRRITMSEALLNPGACPIKVQVLSVIPGVYSAPVEVAWPGGAVGTAEAVLGIGSPPRVAQAFAAPSAAKNTPVALTITLTNPNAVLGLSPVNFYNSLPAGLTVATPNGLVNNCAGAVSAEPASSLISLSNANLPPGACTIKVNVISRNTGQYTNSIYAISPAGWSSGSTATLAVIDAALPPTFEVKLSNTPAFGQPAQLTLKVSNPNPSAGLSGIVLPWTLPSALAVSGTPSNTCGGTVSSPATQPMKLEQGQLAGGASCEVTLTLIAATPGRHNITAGPVTIGPAVAAANSGTTSSLFVVAPASSYLMRHALNLDAGDAAIYMANSGSSATDDKDQFNGQLCVGVYAFSPDEQMVSCCSCVVRRDGQSELSVKEDLLATSLTPALHTKLTTVLVGSAMQGKSCNAGRMTYEGLRGGLHAWGEMLLEAPAIPGNAPPNYQAVAGRFVKNLMTTATLERITRTCAYIQANGSGYGICRGCRFNGASAGDPITNEE